jgi:anti-sigma regulatory factor (Ser/Thr protein kinase)
MTNKITVQGKLEKLLDIHQWLESIALQDDLPTSSLYAMKLCCEESFMNIVMHSYDSKNTSMNEVDQIIFLQMDRFPNNLQLLIEDNGPLFNPLKKKETDQPKDLMDAQIGGLGISLMKTFCNNIRYEPKNSGNRLIFQFSI